MNKNLNKYFENDFENVNWVDLFKNPKYFTQDTEVEKPKYVPNPWEVKRNYQLEQDNKTLNEQLLNLENEIKEGYKSFNTETHMLVEREFLKNI